MSYLESKFGLNGKTAVITGGGGTLCSVMAEGYVKAGANVILWDIRADALEIKEKMIAEINAPFSPKLILLDGIDAFVDGGPAFGERAKGDVFLASRDRVATDAVGVAVLKVLGSNNAIMGKAIFQQGQIVRAVELGIGVSSPEEIKVVPADSDSEDYCIQVAAVLKQG